MGMPSGRLASAHQPPTILMLINLFMAMQFVASNATFGGILGILNSLPVQRQVNAFIGNQGRKSLEIPSVS